MKKLILIVCLLGATTANAMSESACTNRSGTPYTANGKVYCLSPNAMNWWSAHAWCNAFGAQLVDLMEECDEGFAGSLSCPKLKLGSSVPSSAWTKNVPNSSSAYIVDLSSGAIRDINRSNSVFGNMPALCQ